MMRTETIRLVLGAAILSAGLTMGSLPGCATAPKDDAGKQEQSTHVDETLAKAKKTDPTLEAFLGKAYGYAIFPTVGKGAVGIGGAYGKGQLFEQGKRVGYCDLSQATIGLALGGQSYTEIIAFENKEALDKFRNGGLKFAAQVTAVALQAGAALNAKYTDGVSVMTMGEKGLMAEASVGGQSFSYQPM
jgi:lipid-binding SYLF domain-containing protein